MNWEQTAVLGDQFVTETKGWTWQPKPIGTRVKDGSIFAVVAMMILTVLFDRR